MKRSKGAVRAGWTAQRHVSLALLRHRAVESAVSTVVVRGSLALVDGGGFAKNERELLALRLAVVLVLEGGRLSRNGHAAGLVGSAPAGPCLLVELNPNLLDFATFVLRLDVLHGAARSVHQAVLHVDVVPQHHSSAYGHLHKGLQTARVLRLGPNRVR